MYIHILESSHHLAKDYDSEYLFSVSNSKPFLSTIRGAEWKCILHCRLAFYQFLDLRIVLSLTTILFTFSIISFHILSVFSFSSNYFMVCEGWCEKPSFKKKGGTTGGEGEGRSGGMGDIGGIRIHL